MQLPIVQVDAFSAEAFGGNPAAVCLLTPEEAAALDATLMQKIGAENNLSETVFVHPEGEAYAIRWFTPTTEVDLCGHATLAAAHVMFADGHVPRERTIEFRSKSGPLRAESVPEGIALDFPANPVEPAEPLEGLGDALGVDSAAIIGTGRSRFDYVCILDRESRIRPLRPDFSALGRIDARGILVTAAGDGEYDFVSRCFFPATGINEDPVTGSAHCALGPLWADRLQRKSFKAYQASPRGGTVHVQVDGDRVHLKGPAVVTLRGVLEF